MYENVDYYLPILMTKSIEFNEKNNGNNLINNNEIYIEYAPPSSPKRRKMENPRIKFSKSITKYNEIIQKEINKI